MAKVQLKLLLLAATVWLLGAAPVALEAPILADSSFSTPDNGQQPVIDAIGGAKSTIQMWMYSMSTPAVVQALERAANNGVKVEIIFDKGEFKKGTVVSDLKSAGVTVYQATDQFSLSHAKTFIVDGGTAYIMSLNLTTIFAVVRDSAIVTHDETIISDLKTLFAADITNSRNNTNTTPDLSSSNLVVSPVNSATRIIALIQSAQKSVDMTVENLGYKDVVSALEERAKAGVKVRVITPLCDMITDHAYNVPAMQELTSAGAGARMMGYPASATTPYIHQKMIIVDGAKFFIGSENFSMNSLENSREIGVVVTLDDSTSEIAARFEQDWQNAGAVPTDTTALKKCDPISTDQVSSQDNSGSNNYSD